jgi:hypothetical protein
MENSVSDPYSFDTYRIRIRIQHFRLNIDPDPIRIHGIDDQKLENKFTAGKKIHFFKIKNYNLPKPRPPSRTSKLQKKPSALKKELQHFKT